MSGQDLFGLGGPIPSNMLTYLSATKETAINEALPTLGPMGRVKG